MNLNKVDKKWKTVLKKYKKFASSCNKAEKALGLDESFGLSWWFGYCTGRLSASKVDDNSENYLFDRLVHGFRRGVEISEEFIKSEGEKK